MLRVLLGAFIVAHGLLTAFIWTSPARADAPFRATHS
jgi:phage-related protein